MATAPSTASKARTRKSAAQTAAEKLAATPPVIPQQRGRKSPESKVTTPDQTTTTPVYYAGMGHEAIKADLISSGKLLNGNAQSYARKMCEAFLRDVHGKFGVTWEVFVKDVTESVAWDKAMWPTMVKILRDCGMENKDVAAAIKISEITVKRLNAKCGRVNIKRQAGQLKSVSGKASDGGTYKASVSGPASKLAFEPTYRPATNTSTVDTSKVASVVKAAKVDELVKALASRPDANAIVMALLAASQAK